jgi:hypothetical protein
MAWDLKENPDGTWHWSCYHSAYGAAVGDEPTLAEAKVELAIAWHAIGDNPYPPSVIAAMRADTERFAADFPDPAP